MKLIWGQQREKKLSRISWSRKKEIEKLYFLLLSFIHKFFVSWPCHSFSELFSLSLFFTWWGNSFFFFFEEDFLLLLRFVHNKKSIFCINFKVHWIFLFRHILALKGNDQTDMWLSTRDDWNISYVVKIIFRVLL